MRVSSTEEDLPEKQPSSDSKSVPLIIQSNTHKSASDLQFYDQISRQERGSAFSENNNRTDSKASGISDCNSVKASSTPSECDKEATMIAAVAKPQNSEQTQCGTETNDNAPSPHPAEICGALAKNANRVVVRPIAFKPVIPGKRNESSSPERSSFTPISYDEGYSSYDTASRGCSNSVSALSKDSDTVYASPIQISAKQQQAQNEWMAISDANFERLLQEKESEILKLRRTMELNESAIVRVHEHKRLEWENQMNDLAQEYHRRLRVQQDTSHDRESELRQTMAKLEIDNRQLAVNIQQNMINRDRQEHNSAQLHKQKQRNTDLNNRLTRELCECDRLRQQNKDLDMTVRKLQEQQSVGTHEQERLNTTIAEMDEAKCKAEREHNIKFSQLRQQIQQQEQQLQDEKEKFKAEKKKWQEEKEKVMQYQKQLQRTYAQMYRRNNELEQQLCRINSRRLERLETQSLQGYIGRHQDRHTMIEVDLESCPESFC